MATMSDLRRWDEQQKPTTNTTSRTEPTQGTLNWLSAQLGQTEQPAISTGSGVAGSSGDWWDIMNRAGSYSPTFAPISAPSVGAPSVKAPEIPKTPEVIPGYYTGQLGYGEGERPESEIEQLIAQITGSELRQAPTPVVNEEYINQMLSQYGIAPKTPEEINEYAQAIVDRQKYTQEQVLMREIDRFERDFPNEFRKAAQRIRSESEKLSADKQEEMAARGLFYSSIMRGAVGDIDNATLNEIADISASAANYVTDLRADVRDLAQWAALEQEVIRRELETQEENKRMNLMQMHIEIATWADQMALDSWYKQESLQLQKDQLDLQAIQLKQQEAERLGQHMANAFMADHPLVQNTMMSLGISPEAFASMPIEQQSGMVSSIVNYNDIEQQMRAREFQMRATIAEIQLQNASLQLQASIANAQMSMDAQRLQLQQIMHADQMSLNWAQHGLDVAIADWQMSQPIGGGSYGTVAEEELAASSYSAGLLGSLYEYQQQGLPKSVGVELINEYYSNGLIDSSLRSRALSEAEKIWPTERAATQPKTTSNSWLQNILGGYTPTPSGVQPNRPVYPYSNRSTTDRSSNWSTIRSTRNRAQ